MFEAAEEFNAMVSTGLGRFNNNTDSLLLLLTEIHHIFSLGCLRRTSILWSEQSVWE
jgi:hypothetical protein